MTFSLDNPAPKAHRTHEDFNHPTSDVTIQSSDGVLFHLHRQNLAFGTGAFPPASSSAILPQNPNEITYLTESAEVLGLVFRFVYPGRHPDLEDEELGFQTVLGVAEAVEKYEVWAGMNTCRLRLRDFIPLHAAEVMGHFVKHGYSIMVNECVPHIARSPLMEVLEVLPFECVLPWLRYQEAYKTIFQSARKYIKAKPMDGEGLCHYPMTVCNRCRLVLNAYVNELEEAPSLTALHAALDKGGGFQVAAPIYAGDSDCMCKTCAGRGCKYLGRVSELCRMGVQGIPPFTEFLKVGYRYRLPEMKMSELIN